MVLLASASRFASAQGQNDGRSSEPSTAPSAPGPGAQVQPGSPWKRLPGYLWDDQKAIWTSPFRASRQNVKWWVVFGSVTAGLIATDEWTSKQLPNTNSQVSVSTWASRFGQIYVLAPAAAGLYTLGAKRDNDRLRETGLMALEALADSAIVTEVLKAATQRQRPLEGTGEGGFWQGKGRIWNSGASFPSGHAIETWTMASVIAHEYPHPRIIPVLVYAYAMGVNAARFAARRHFASDIMAGAAMGWFIGEYTYTKRHSADIDEQQSAFRRALAHVHFGGLQ
ncbi:MAG TPA: phosphatase PAP2 family protein [Bryobacteraceae bacterium]|nr:phosphatase PAP2 family protein [Bryobacteraceae bacterium]